MLQCAFLLHVISYFCPHFCLQKWNLLCNWEYHAICVRVQLCWHEETVLSNISHSGSQADVKMSRSKWLQQHRRTNRVAQGESKNTLYTGWWSAPIVQWLVGLKSFKTNLLPFTFVHFNKRLAGIQYVLNQNLLTRSHFCLLLSPKKKSCFNQFPVQINLFQELSKIKCQVSSF